MRLTGVGLIVAAKTTVGGTAKAADITIGIDATEEVEIATDGAEAGVEAVANAISEVTAAGIATAPLHGIRTSTRTMSRASSQPRRRHRHRQIRTADWSR